MDEIKEMENLEIEETPEVTDEVTDLVPVEETENSIGVGEKAAVVTLIGLAVVGAAAITERVVGGISRLVAKKKERKESKELDQKMEQHPGFLGKFKKNKTEKTAEEVPEKKE